MIYDEVNEEDDDKEDDDNSWLQRDVATSQLTTSKKWIETSKSEKQDIDFWKDPTFYLCVHDRDLGGCNISF